MSKTLSWTEAPRATSVARRLTAAALRGASIALGRLARRLRVAEAAPAKRLPVIEFTTVHHEAGAPEGALYVDGELVGYLPVTRL